MKKSEKEQKNFEGDWPKKKWKRVENKLRKKKKIQAQAYPPTSIFGVGDFFDSLRNLYNRL